MSIFDEFERRASEPNNPILNVVGIVMAILVLLVMLFAPIGG